MKYRKKPVVVEVMRFTDKNKDQVFNWVRCNTVADFDEEKNPILKIQTNEGVMIAEIGDYIIEEPFPSDGRLFYPCKPDIFEKTYEAVR